MALLSLQSCRCSRTAPDLHVPLLEISAMAYFPINTTSHSESLRHGFSTRIHSQTRWRLKNNTHTSSPEIFCTRAVQKLENETGSRVFHEIRSLQIHIALLLRLTGHADPPQGPRRTVEHLGGYHGNTIRTASIERGRDFLYVRNVGNKRIAFCGRVSAALEDGAQQGGRPPRWSSRVQNTD